MSENPDGLDIFDRLSSVDEPGDATQDERHYLRRRRLRWIAIGVGIVVVGALFIGGWFTARIFESPAQKEASATAPKAQPVTAEVVRGTLGQTFTARMTVAPTTSLNAVIPASGSPAYITSVVAGPGTVIGAGSLITTVNGTPVFSFVGAFPFYRDMAQGDTGLDITQLQQGLISAGYSVTADGKYGATTAAAVTKLFTAAGFTPPTTPNPNVTGDSANSTPTGTATSTPTGTTSPQATAPPAASTPVTTNTATQPATLSMFPLADLMTFGQLPARVVAAPSVGTPVTGDTKLTVQLGPLQGTGPVAPSVAANLKAGMPGTLQLGTQSVPITVQNISAPDPNAGNTTVTLAPEAGQTLPESWNGQQALATITITASDGDVLIVPSNAISTDGTGGGTVLKRQRNGTFIEVRVRELSQLDGRSSVAPVTDGALRAGDVVQVGS